MKTNTAIVLTGSLFCLILTFSFILISIIPSHKSPPTNIVSTTAVAAAKALTFQIPKGEALMQYYNHEVLTTRIEGKKHVLKVYALNTSSPTTPKYIITYP